MPEGHTLRRLADDLTAAFAGRTVAVSSPQGRFGAEAALLHGSTVLRADAAGKHLFLELEGGHVVHVHLGLIGTFRIATGEPPPPVGQVRLRLVAAGGGRETTYADLRGAITCALITPEQEAAVVARLGPDPLRPDADPARAWTRISRSPRSVGDLLMDQSVMAGVGNVYRAETLFRQRLEPVPTRHLAASREVRGAVGRPRRADGRGRAHEPDRHRAAGAHARGDGARREA